MGAVRKYHVTHNGYRTIMKLSDADVRLYPDAVLVDESPADEAAETPAETPAETGSKASTPANKGRTAANKSKGS